MTNWENKHFVLLDCFHSDANEASDRSLPSTKLQTLLRFITTIIISATIFCCCCFVLVKGSLKKMSIESIMCYFNLIQIPNSGCKCVKGWLVWVASGHKGPGPA